MSAGEFAGHRMQKSREGGFGGFFIQIGSFSVHVGVCIYKRWNKDMAAVYHG